MSSDCAFNLWERLLRVQSLHLPVVGLARRCLYLLHFSTIWLFIQEPKISVNERKRKAMGEEKVTIKIGVDTTELNQKLDESIKKATELMELLQQLGITPLLKINTPYNNANRVRGAKITRRN